MDLFGQKKPEILFQELAERYKVAIHRYYDATRRACSTERGSTVAFELADIFKEAHEQLPEDPEHTFSFERFQTTCDDIRGRCFAQQDVNEPPC